MSIVISIIITAFGVLGLFVSILSIFFEIHQIEKIKLSKKNMIFVIFWTALFILGIMNLCYSSNNTDNDSIDNNITTIDNNNFTQAELLIDQNFDQIRKLKSKYTMLDCRIIHGNNLGLYFAEKACYVFRNAQNNKGYELIGDKVYPDKVIILDYSNNEILYVLTPKDNTIEYTPENQKVFYGVIFATDYEICVTPPFKVVGGDSEYRPDICFDKEGSNFALPIQIYTHIHDLKSDKQYSIPSTDYEIKIAYRSIKYGYEENALYNVNVLDSDMISFDEDFTYFSLNENYEMYIYLYRKIGGEYESEYVAEQTFDGSITDSNFVEIVFDVEDINK